MYSRVQPSVPMQFVANSCDERVPFWGFPAEAVPTNVSEAQLSALYDRVIADALLRLSIAEPQPQQQPDSSLVAPLYRDLTFAFAAILGALAIGGLCVYCVQQRRSINAASGGNSAAEPLAADSYMAPTPPVYVVSEGSGQYVKL